MLDYIGDLFYLCIVNYFTSNVIVMKPQMNFSGKGRWAKFWGDKVKKKLKRIFSKSDRQKTKKEIVEKLIE